jgi:hypothetical protein
MMLSVMGWLDKCGTFETPQLSNNCSPAREFINYQIDYDKQLCGLAP